MRGTCIEGGYFYGMAVFTDLVVFAIPTRFFIRLQLKLKLRLGPDRPVLPGSKERCPSSPTPLSE